MTTRLAYCVTHPIQYQVPWLRLLHRDPSIDLKVFFMSSFDSRVTVDAGFGVHLDHGLDLKTGYTHCTLRAVGGDEDPASSRRLMVRSIAPLRDFRPDVILLHGWSHYAHWAVALHSFLYRVPLMLRGESHPAPRISPLVRALVRRASACLAVGVRNRQFYLHAGAMPQRIMMAPYGVDNEYFRPKPSDYLVRARLRQEWGASDRVLLFSGKLQPWKNPHTLLYCAKATSSLAVFAGSGPLQNDLVLAAKEVGVEARFLGPVSQPALRDIYHGTDMLLLPSSIEPWGLVVNEALASGLPVVCSEAVGAAEDFGRRPFFQVFKLDAAGAAERAAEMALRSTYPSSEALDLVAKYDVTVTARAISEAAALVARSK